MKIIAPISRCNEVGPLADAGADEFYCGIVPEEWIRRFGSSGVNRRVFCNLSTYEELGTAIETAHQHSAQLSLVMNAPHYAEEQLQELLGIARRFADIGGDSLIVGDMGLLQLLATKGPPLRLHVSSLLTCRNSEAAALYRDMGAARVILPRDITLEEIAGIVSLCPDLEFEAFILNDGCVFEDGSCHTIHLPSQLGGPICLDRYQVEHSRADGRPLSDSEREQFAAHETRYQNWVWHRFGQGFAPTGDGYPFGPCGICAMPWMAEHGVTAIKIAGREASTARKAKSVEMVRRVRDRILAGQSAAEVRSFAEGLRGPGVTCESGMACYYRNRPDQTHPRTLCRPMDA